MRTYEEILSDVGTVNLDYHGGEAVQGGEAPAEPAP